jgi:mono/diheme cytochrome c family protein
MRLLLILSGIVVVLCVAAGAGFWFISAPRALAAGDLPTHDPDPEHGRWVFHAAGCGGCHSPPDAKGNDRYLLGGGVALTTAFGTFHAPNISPDPEEGIGGWSELDFVNAVLRGVSPEGAHYYPAFPYVAYQRMQIEDALDLKAFIDTLPPVADRSPEHELPPFFRIRRGIGLWKRVYMAREPFIPGPDADPMIRRGAYLVTALGHCGECHTPRDRLGGSIASRFLAGGPAPDDQTKTVPNITPHADGIGNWSVEDITDALRTGFLPDFETFGGAMVEVQKNLAELTDEDREAIALYLKAVPPLPDELAE